MVTQTSRPHRFNMMLSTLEHEMLTEIAEARGLTAADVFRQLLRMAHRDEFAGPVATNKTGAKKRGRK